MKILFIVAFVFVSGSAFSQDSLNESPVFGKVTIEKDGRLDVLETKMAEYNQSLLTRKTRTAQGYRLMLLSTSDRNQALNLRSSLIQQYPDQKVYMLFKSPFIKIKFGDYLEKKDAEDMRKQLLKSGLITGNIYIVPETIEVKPEKIEEEQ